MIKTQLNFPRDITLNIVEKEDGQFVFDPVRKIDVLFTPEENVRQHLIHYLLKYKGYSAGLMAIEKKIVVNHLTRRPDLVVYNREQKPWFVIECKRPEEKLTQKVIEQIAQYNSLLKSEYLCITNGLEHFIFQLDYTKNTFVSLTEFPELYKKVDK